MVRPFLRAIRAHQFIKNLLLFTPLLAGHLHSLNAIVLACFAFIAFSATSASVYLSNDLIDLKTDRQHPTKRLRPLASGELPVKIAFIAIPCLLLAALIISLTTLNYRFILILVVYYLLTLAYSLLLKKKALFDVFTLAILYTLRVIAGIAAVGTLYSPWLLAFSFFFFLNLAFLKRDTELFQLQKNGHSVMFDKDYGKADATVIKIFGIASGFMSIVILALYINSAAVVRIYSNPQWLWGTTLIIFAWITHLWLTSSRGEMNQDPVLFAIRDSLSLVAGVCALAFALLATYT